MGKLLIITGGSKGIGLGIIKAYQQNGFTIVSISRSINEDIALRNVNQIAFDLLNTSEIEAVLLESLKSVSLSKLKAITLINNAGTLGEITTIDRKKANDISETITLNTTVPLILTATFLKYTKDLNCRKKIITISSGAAKNPYSGWVTYCASKAAIDMMTRATALEQDAIVNGAKIIAIYPGVVDTGMQGQIRKSSKADFADLDKFLNYKTAGLLATADHVGKEIFNIDYELQYENGALIRISDGR